MAEETEDSKWELERKTGNKMFNRERGKDNEEGMRMGKERKKERKKGRKIERKEDKRKSRQRQRKQKRCINTREANRTFTQGASANMSYLCI